jgi:Zn-dependent metalloprotease
MPVNDPQASPDPIVQNVLALTTEAARFFAAEFGRNSIDDHNAPLLGSIHFGTPSGQAIWSGGRVVYSDGDNVQFGDPSRCDDIVGHEITHAVVQHTLQLPTTRTEAGGLNESIADVFGIMFRQRRAGVDAGQSDWLMGGDLIGPSLAATGVRCVRDFSRPDAPHCLKPQLTHYNQFAPKTIAHVSSGIANHAFYRVATAIGGPSWAVAGRIWYRAIVASGPTPGLLMKAFADRTRASAAELFAGSAAIAAAVDGGWTAVGL